MKHAATWMMGLILLGAATGQAEPPTITQQVTPGTMSYQGRLQTADGTDYANGIYTIDFKLYDGAASSATLLWGATYQPYVNNGFFSVILGQTSVGEEAIAGAAYTAVDEFWKAVWIDPNGSSTDRYLGITVHQDETGADISGADESFPRQQLLASPFAIQSQFAQQAVYADSATMADHAVSAVEATYATQAADDFSVGNDMTVGAGLTVGDGLTVGADLSVTNDLTVGGSLTLGSHEVSAVVEAPASGMRIVAGSVSHEGGEISNPGNQYTVTRNSPEAGCYSVSFNPPFSETPVVVASVHYSDTSLSEYDNVLSAEAVSAAGFVMRARDDDGNWEDTAFYFIAIGR